MTTTEETIVGSGADEAVGVFNQPASPVASPLRTLLDPRLWLASGGGRTIPLLLAMVVMWIAFDIDSGGVYFGSQNITNILVYTSLYGIVAIGVVIVLLLGEIDLSLGSLVGLAGCSAALVMVEWVPTAPQFVQMLVGVAVSLAVGIACGAFQGFWIALAKVPSFVVSLAGLLAFSGISLVITNSQTVVITSDYFNAFGSTSTSAFDGGYLPTLVGKGTNPLHLSVGMIVAIVIGIGYAVILLLNRRSRRANGLPTRGVGLLVLQALAVLIPSVVLADFLDRYQGLPLPVFIMIVLLIVIAYVLRRTRFGRHIYSTGGNAEAARRAGISVTRVRWSAFILSGLMAGIVGVIFMARNASASAGAVDPSFLLLCIASAVIGGTSLFGGRGSVWSALTGALLLASLQTGMTLLLAGSTNAQYYQYIVEGAILLGAVWLDTYSRKRVVVDRGG
ncbi:MAG TPA: hypothetical protein VFB34_03600 [Chloroflexota bacterium]|nr:hypothetical protein [Chloroflexota bacterium]